MGYDIKGTANIKYFYDALTNGQVAEMSGGKIPLMSPEQASGLVGSWIVETGQPGLNQLDVVENNAKAGRGLSQYTGARRDAYDAARAQAQAQGIDPNSPDWQLKYFVDEYTGKHDTNGASLIGYTKVFENAPKTGTAQQFADYYTGSAASGSGYFRPGVPHTNKRMDSASQVYKIYATPARPPTGAAAAGTRPQTAPAVKPVPVVAPRNQFQPGIQSPKNLFQNLTIPFQ